MYRKKQEDWLRILERIDDISLEKGYSHGYKPPWSKPLENQASGGSSEVALGYNDTINFARSKGWKVEVGSYDDRDKSYDIFIGVVIEYNGRAKHFTFTRPRRLIKPGVVPPEPTGTSETVSQLLDYFNSPG